MPGIWPHHARDGGVNDLTDNFMKCLANIRGVVRYFLCLLFLNLFVTLCCLLVAIVGLSLLLDIGDIGSMYCW